MLAVFGSVTGWPASSAAFIAAAPDGSTPITRTPDAASLTAAAPQARGAPATPPRAARANRRAGLRLGAGARTPQHPTRMDWNCTRRMTKLEPVRWRLPRAFESRKHPGRWLNRRNGQGRGVRFKVQGARCRVQGAGCKVRVQGSGCSVRLGVGRWALALGPLALALGPWPLALWP